MTTIQTIEAIRTGQDRAHTPPDARAAGAWPFFADDEIEVAVRVLRSGKVNCWTGQEGRLFESEFAAFVGCKYANRIGQWHCRAGVRFEGSGRGAVR